MGVAGAPRTHGTEATEVTSRHFFWRDTCGPPAANDLLCNTYAISAAIGSAFLPLSTRQGFNSERTPANEISKNHPHDDVVLSSDRIGLRVEFGQFFIHQLFHGVSAKSAAAAPASPAAQKALTSSEGPDRRRSQRTFRDRQGPTTSCESPMVRSWRPPTNRLPRRRALSRFSPRMVTWWE